MNEFTARVKAILDTSTVEQQLNDLQKKEITINVEADVAGKQLDEIDKKIDTVKKSTNIFGKSLKSVFNIGSAAAIVAKGFSQISKAAHNAITAAKGFDAAVTDVRMVTGVGYSDAAKMVKEYNKLGQSLGMTTKETTDAATVWLRQGKTTQETNKLIWETAKLSKIGFIDTADAAAFLTSALNGYNLTVDDSTAVIDKLAKLDSSAAVTAGGLAEAMSRTAVTANMAGVSMDKLLGYLATVGEVSQRSMSSVGESFKTFFSRMSDIKTGKLELIDGDGTSELLSDVELALKNVGIDLRETLNEYNDYGDVLDSIAAKWDTLNQVQQNAITKAIGGVRQGENFRILMENYETAKKYTELAADSAGTAETKFTAYLDSIEAKTKSLHAAFESLAVNNLSTELLGGIINATTALIEFFDKTNLLKGTLAGLAAVGAVKGFTILAVGISSATAKLNAFNSALKIIKSGNIGDSEISQLAQMTANLSQSQLKAVLSSQALTTQQRLAILTAQGLSATEAQATLVSMGLATAENVATSATISLSGAFKGLWATLMANPLIIVAAAIAAVVSVASSMRQAAVEARQAAIDSAKSSASLSSELSELVADYTNLSEAVKTDTDATDSFAEAQDKLIDKLGLSRAEIQGLTGDYNNLGDAIKATSVKKLQELERDIRGGLNEYEKDLLKAGKSDLMSDYKAVSGSKINGLFTTSPETRQEQRNAYTALKALEDAGLIPGGSYSSYVDKDGSKYSQGFSFIMGTTADEDLSTIEGIINAHSRLGQMLDIVSDSAGSDNFVFKSLYETYNKLTEPINNYQDLLNSLNGNLAEQYVLQGLIGKAAPTTKEEFNKYRKSVIDAATASGEFVGSQEQVEAAIDKVLHSQSQFVPFMNDYVETIFNAQEATLTSSEDTVKQAGRVLESYKTVAAGISDVLDLLSSQKTGKSVSIDDFNSDTLADYRSALEQVNGAMQLNTDNVKEIIKAKADEQIATNNTNKAMAQLKYLENVRQIEKYRKELRNVNFTNEDTRNQIENKIKSLQEENSTIADTCKQYDLLSASLQEAVSAYQHWMNAQNASDYGDIANDAISAIKRISDTYNSGSGIFGDYGSKKFAAAVDFIIPDSVNSDDLGAIEKYMDDFKSYLTLDDSGKTTLNIDKFLSASVEAGLMSYSNDDGFKVLAGKKMADFAEGLSLSSGVVQAFFDELQLKGGKFNWGDEAIKTIGDLAIEASQAAEALRNVDGNSNLKIKIDVSDLATTEEQCKVLDDTINEMDRVKARPGVDATDIDNANAVIQYCLAQKHLLTQPDVMRVDTSRVSGDIGSALALLQQFHNAQNGFEITQKIGADTSAAQTEVDSLTEQIQAISPDIKAKLSLDTTSAESISKSIAGLTAEAINVKANVDASAISGYNPENKTCEVIYNPNTDILPQSFDSINRTVNYLADTSGLPQSFSTITRYVRYEKTGDGSANGTAHASGTAKAGGDWGSAPGGRTLVGELGQEIVVDPRTGRWYTVGDNGAEFRDIPAGAIVFNHLQSKSLLENGYVSGRASALVGGTAMVTGTYKPHISSGSEGGDGSGSSKGSSSSSSSSSDKLEEFDWIEIAINRIERAVNKLKTTATSAYKTLKTRLGATYDEITKVNEELSIQQRAYNRYIQQANAVGLSSDLAAKVKDGTIDISKYDKETSELIKDYQKWHDKAEECIDKIDDLNKEIASLYIDSFDSIQADFDRQLSLLEHKTNTYKTGLDMLEAQGYLQSMKYYTALSGVEKQNLSALHKELAELENMFSEGMNSGEIEEYSEAWYSMKIKIDGVKESIEKANLQVVEYAKTIRQLEWSYFDYTQERISQLTKEASFLIELISNSDLYDDNGRFSDAGTATLGLRAQSYNIHMAQADQYAKEILRLDKEIANDPYNTELIERREKLLGLQQDSIKSAEEEKEAIVSMVREGIEVELSALKELINSYTDALDSAKDLYNYQKKVKDQTSEITTLQKKIAAYGNDTSEETRATVQKLKVELGKAQENLQETEYERYISDQKKLLDDLYDEYEEILNQRLDNTDALISDMIVLVNEKSDSINQTLVDVANNAGYTITDSMKNIWDGSTGEIDGTISKYGDKFTEQLTAVNGVLNLIQANTSAMIAASDSDAMAYEKSTIENGDVLKDLAPQSLTLGNQTYEAAITSPSGLTDISNTLTKISSNFSSAAPSVGNVNVDVKIDHVEDYNDFVTKLKKDNQFEKMIQSMTIGALVGGSALSKNKYYWDKKK